MPIGGAKSLSCKFMLTDRNASSLPLLISEWRFASIPVVQNVEVQPQPFVQLSLLERCHLNVSNLMILIDWLTSTWCCCLRGRFFNAPSSFASFSRCPFVGGSKFSPNSPRANDRLLLTKNTAMIKAKCIGQKILVSGIETNALLFCTKNRNRD